MSLFLPIGASEFERKVATAVNALLRRIDKLDGTTAATLSDYADDVAAAAGGVPVGGLYRNGSVVQVRVT
jgi:hypothetical protein